MNRDEFEKAYAEKYTSGDVIAVFGNRDFKRYTDPHIDLCWKVQQLLDYIRSILKHYPNVIKKIESIIEW